MGFAFGADDILDGGLREPILLTPWLQPGDPERSTVLNRFNGLPRRETVETVEEKITSMDHPAEATVLMSSLSRGPVNK